jgi:ketosteroid isomerase-like protein
MSAADDARGIIAAWQSGGVDAVVPLVHPEFVGEVGPETSVEPDTYVGEAGIRRYFRLWEEAMDDLRLEIVTIEEVGPESAIAELRLSGRGVGSGVPVSFSAWTPMVFEDGLLRRIHGSADRESALRVAQTAHG